jgi:hypothetical protein
MKQIDRHPDRTLRKTRRQMDGQRGGKTDGRTDRGIDRRSESLGLRSWSQNKKEFCNLDSETDTICTLIRQSDGHEAMKGNTNRMKDMLMYKHGFLRN